MKKNNRSHTLITKTNAVIMGTYSQFTFNLNNLGTLTTIISIMNSN